MQKAPLKYKNKNIGQAYLFFDFNTKVKNRDKFVLNIVNQIKPVKGFGYAGFSHKKYLVDKLMGTMFDKDTDQIEKLDIDSSEVLNLLRASITLAQNKLRLNPLSIYVFPLFNTFIKKKMGGTSGSVIWKNTMLLFINPIKDWQSHFAGSIIHEYNHSVSFKYNRWNTLLDKFVIEGWAEVFLEETLPKAPYKVGRTLSYIESKKIFRSIKSRLNSTNDKIYNDYFYGNKKFPLWTGYSIGYWIVKDFRKKYPDLAWSKLIKISPKKILRESQFGS